VTDGKPYKVDVEFLYVRPSYKDLHKLISTSLAGNNVIITGTPGAGKSMFALYELYLAIKADKTVVFYHQPSDTTSVFDKLTNRAFKATPDDVLSYLDEEDTVYLHDSGTKIPAQCRSSGRMLVFSSPERTNFADIEKISTGKVRVSLGRFEYTEPPRTTVM